MSLKGKNTTSRLRHRLTLQQEIRTADGVGGYIRSWKDIVNLWAEIIPLNGKEKLYAGQLQAQVSHKILLRYRDGVTADNRLVFENRIFNIRSVVNADENNDVLEVLVEEGVAA